MAVPEWPRYLLTRERLRQLGAADHLLTQFEQMGPTAALPLMDDLIAGGKDAILKVNWLMSRLA